MYSSIGGSCIGLAPLSVFLTKSRYSRVKPSLRSDSLMQAARPCIRARKFSAQRRFCWVRGLRSDQMPQQLGWQGHDWSSVVISDNQAPDDMKCRWITAYLQPYLMASLCFRYEARDIGMRSDWLLKHFRQSLVWLTECVVSLTCGLADVLRHW